MKAGTQVRVLIDSPPGYKGKVGKVVWMTSYGEATVEFPEPDNCLHNGHEDEGHPLTHNRYWYQPDEIDAQAGGEAASQPEVSPGSLLLDAIAGIQAAKGELLITLAWFGTQLAETTITDPATALRYRLTVVELEPG